MERDCPAWLTTGSGCKSLAQQKVGLTASEVELGNPGSRPWAVGEPAAPGAETPAGGCSGAGGWGGAAGPDRPGWEPMGHALALRPGSSDLLSLGPCLLLGFETEDVP